MGTHCSQDFSEPFHLHFLHHADFHLLLFIFIFVDFFFLFFLRFQMIFLVDFLISFVSQWAGFYFTILALTALWRSWFEEFTSQQIYQICRYQRSYDPSQGTVGAPTCSATASPHCPFDLLFANSRVHGLQILNRILRGRELSTSMPTFFSLGYDKLSKCTYNLFLTFWFYAFDCSLWLYVPALFVCVWNFL